jgi:centractin
MEALWQHVFTELKV